MPDPKNTADLKNLVVDYYIAFAIMLSAYVVPHAYAITAGMFITIGVGIALYRLRGARLRLAEGDRDTPDLGYAHAQYLIRLFWRVCWVSVGALLVMGMLVGSFGNPEALHEMRAQILSGAMLATDAVDAYMDRYEADNAQVKIVAQLAAFIPMVAYFLWRLHAGWTAAKACTALESKPWRAITPKA